MTPEQVQSSQRHQMNRWFELADKGLDESEKLVELQFSACRDALQEMVHCCDSAGEIHDLPSAFQWQTRALKPFAELSAQYGARWMGLVSNSGREMGRTVENQWQGVTRQMSSWLGDMPKSGAQGPDALFDYLRNTMKAFDNVWESARHNLQVPQAKTLSVVASTKSSPKSAARKASS